jgi:cytochrome P450
MLNVLNLHRNPEYWGEDAEKFVPERFETERFAKVHPHAYVPFASKFKAS